MLMLTSFSNTVPIDMPLMAYCVSISLYGLQSSVGTHAGRMLTDALDSPIWLLEVNVQRNYRSQLVRSSADIFR